MKKVGTSEKNVQSFFDTNLPDQLPYIAMSTSSIPKTSAINFVEAYIVDFSGVSQQASGSLKVVST